MVTRESCEGVMIETKENGNFTSHAQTLQELVISFWVTEPLNEPL